MMRQIIRRLTAIKKTNEVTSMQVLSWARRLETLIQAINENKDFEE